MYTKLVLLFLVAAVTSQRDDALYNFFYGTTKYTDDATTWARLRNEYLTKAPYNISPGYMMLHCRIVKECCSSEVDDLFSMIHEQRLDKPCMGTQGSKLYNSHTSDCLGFTKNFHDIQKTAEYSKAELVTRIPPLNERFKEWRSEMIRTCSTDELRAYVCDPFNMDSFRSCAEKVLRKIDGKDGGAAYITFFEHIETDYHTLIERITKAFPYVV
ncbi:unnamed protein product [Adineta steineri]|uniref:Uncharacterized protein n=1 Tax=Adineta steineri TaxID=433720 RepID=A0A816EMW1_9BILA|nr:unnamed protein product [Adineta steineri]CAF1651744.1 unnamed protein product [Adineta steineri]